jgi:integrase/recombinase XerD
MIEEINSFLASFEGAKDKAYSDNTVQAYRNDLKQFAEFLRTSLELNDWSSVRPEHIHVYVEDLHSHVPGYASSTIARKVAAIKSFFHFLAGRAVVAEDPTVGLESPKVKKRLPRALTAESVVRLLDAPPRNGTPKAVRDRALLELLYATGMRVSEVVSMLVEDIELETGRIRCPSPSGKERMIPVDGRALQALNEYLERSRPHLARKADEHALFLNHRGQKLTRQGLWLIIKEYATQLHLEGEVITPHTLRHSFAAHKLNSGAKLHELQELLGHANISTTQIYVQMKGEEDGVRRELDGAE